MRPAEIDLDRTRSLRIKWSDGAETVLELSALRRACPCASCRAKRAEHTSGSLPILETSASEQAMVTAAGAELVGNYGLRIRWNDGHDLGIYDFEYLRSLK